MNWICMQNLGAIYFELINLIIIEEETHPKDYRDTLS